MSNCDAATMRSHTEDEAERRTMKCVYERVRNEKGTHYYYNYEH